MIAQDLAKQEVRMRDSERDRERESMCVCMCERERERERACVCPLAIKHSKLLCEEKEKAKNVTDYMIF